MGMYQRLLHLLLALWLGSTAFGAIAADPPGQIRLHPEDLKWGPNVSIPPGVKVALLYGNPKQPGPFMFRVWFPPRYKLPPHTHPDMRHVTVLKGTYLSGNGPVFDESALRAFGPGAFYTNPAGFPHYAMTGDEEVIIQEGGTGPAATLFVDPHDDPRGPR